MPMYLPKDGDYSHWETELGAPSEREVRLVVTMTGALLKYHASP
jgi:hypothetical protein